MAPRAKPFDQQVDRSGEHHLWIGAHKADGTGLVRVGGKLRLARHVAWERQRGPVPDGMQVRRCSVPACVRVDHLILGPAPNAGPKRQSSRGTKGGGTRTQVRPGVWKLSVVVGRYDDESLRREHRTVHADSDNAAALGQAAFAAEIRDSALLDRKADRDMTVDDAVERYLVEYLQNEKGRARRTIDDYRRVHSKWFSPKIGKRRLRDVDEDVMDEIFGRMRRAGLSHSRMNEARSLYAPLFRWAKRRRIVRRNVMVEFEIPTSSYVNQDRTPPEVEELCLLLATAVDVIPYVAPVLVLGAMTGMRRGELVTIRRSDLRIAKLEIVVWTASDGTEVKTTKTRRERVVSVDAATMAMLVRQSAQMDDGAAAHGVEISSDAFLFSLEPDCSRPLAADYVTKQVAMLKEHLGIETKSPEVIAREDEALRLYRQPPQKRPAGRRGPMPTGGLSHQEIGERLGRSSRWAALAIASAKRREEAAARRPQEFFDGSVLALRKFTSSELLDAGFNILAVAGRQGHGPQVLVKHYSRRRRSADRRAAEHLGKVVHRT
jgi:site-specific recombinase XerD